MTLNSRITSPMRLLSKLTSINPSKDFAPQLDRLKDMEVDEIIYILKQEYKQTYESI